MHFHLEQPLVCRDQHHHLEEVVAKHRVEGLLQMLALSLPSSADILQLLESVAQRPLKSRRSNRRISTFNIRWLRCRDGHSCRACPRHLFWHNLLPGVLAVVVHGDRRLVTPLLLSREQHCIHLCKNGCTHFLLAATAVWIERSIATRSIARSTAACGTSGLFTVEAETSPCKGDEPSWAIHVHVEANLLRQ